MKSYYNFVFLFVFLFGCSDDLLLNYERDSIQTHPPTHGKYKTKSIIPSVLDSLRGDFLFCEMVRLSNRSKFYHDYDSVKLLCGDDIHLFDSLYRKHNEALLWDALTYYRNHRSDYRQDFLYYVLYEGSRSVPNQSRSVDVDDVIVDLLTPEYVWRTMESLRTSLLDYSNIIYNDLYGSISRHHTSGCGCQLDKHYIIMYTFGCVAESSIPFEIPYFNMCMWFSDYLSHPISYGAIELDITRIASRLREVGGISGSNRRIMFELNMIADYSPIFRENVIFDLTCTMPHPDVGGGSGGDGSGGTTNPPTDPDPEEPCGDTKCPVCRKCINPSKPNCTKCVCPCIDKKCPICGECFVSTFENPKCNYCTGSDKDLHLLQDSILRLCPNMVSIFFVKDHFLSVRPFYKWDSAELSAEKIKTSNFGNNVYNSLSCIYDFREGDGAMFSDNLIALPRTLLVDRNTDRLAATFLHELFHTRQILSASVKANCEIEAKLAKLIFAEQANITDEQANSDDLIFYDKLKTLRSYIDNKGNISLNDEVAFNELFRQLAEGLSNEFPSYTYDNTTTGIQSIQTLKTYL